MVLQQPLEAVEGGSLTFLCFLVDATSGADALLIRENGVTFLDDRLQDGSLNATHREYILSPINRTDNGRQFTCGAGERNSGEPAVLSVFCKSGLGEKLLQTQTLEMTCTH